MYSHSQFIPKNNESIQFTIHFEKSESFNSQFFFQFIKTHELGSRIKTDENRNQTQIYSNNKALVLHKKLIHWQYVHELTSDLCPFNQKKKNQNEWSRGKNVHENCPFKKMRIVSRNYRLFFCKKKSSFTIFHTCLSIRIISNDMSLLINYTYLSRL